MDTEHSARTYRQESGDVRAAVRKNSLKQSSISELASDMNESASVLIFPIRDPSVHRQKASNEAFVFLYLSACRVRVSSIWK